MWLSSWLLLIFSSFWGKMGFKITITSFKRIYFTFENFLFAFQRFTRVQSIEKRPFLLLFIFWQNSFKSGYKIKLWLNYAHFSFAQPILLLQRKFRGIRNKTERVITLSFFEPGHVPACVFLTNWPQDHVRSDASNYFAIWPRKLILHI